MKLFTTLGPLVFNCIITNSSEDQRQVQLHFSFLFSRGIKIFQELIYVQFLMNIKKRRRIFRLSIASQKYVRAVNWKVVFALVRAVQAG